MKELVKALGDTRILPLADLKNVFFRLNKKCWYKQISNRKSWPTFHNAGSTRVVADDDDDDVDVDDVDEGDLLPLPAHRAEALHPSRAQSLPARHYSLLLGNIPFPHDHNDYNNDYDDDDDFRHHYNMAMTAQAGNILDAIHYLFASIS